MNWSLRSVHRDFVARADARRTPGLQEQYVHLRRDDPWLDLERDRRRRRLVGERLEIRALALLPPIPVAGAFVLRHVATGRVVFFRRVLRRLAFGARKL